MSRSPFFTLVLYYVGNLYPAITHTKTYISERRNFINVHLNLLKCLYFSCFNKSAFANEVSKLYFRLIKIE